MRIQRLGILMLLTVVLASLGCDQARERMHLKRANELYNAQKYEEAIAEYQKILALDPKDWDANYLVAASYLALYHPGSTHPKDLEYAEKGIGAFETLLELPPPSAAELEKVRNFYLGLLTSANKGDKAAEYMEKLLAQDPQNYTLMTQLAGLYAKQGNFEQALKYYEMRANAEPQNKEAWYTVGVICWDRSYNGGLQVSHAEREQVVEKGIEALNKALALDPKYFDALSYINLIYREKSKVLVALGRLDEAREAYETGEKYMKQALEVRGQQSGAAAPAGS